jgi:hypothetical protein
VQYANRATIGGAQQPGVESLLTRLLGYEGGEMVIGGGEISSIIVLRMAPASGHLDLGHQRLRRGEPEYWFVDVLIIADI